MSRKKSSNKDTCVSYRGDIKLSTYIGKHRISTKTYRNKGALPLFRFLANCLAGNFPAAYQLRPYKIRLLKVITEDGIDPNNTPLPQALTANKNVDRYCSDFINLSTAPEISIQETSSGYQCKVSFSFIFPQNYIDFSGANMIAIYGPGVNDGVEYSAYYLLTRTVSDADGNNIRTEWDPIIKDDEDDEANKIYAIEWTMTLANQTKKD